MPLDSFQDRIQLGNTGLESARLGIGSTFNAPAAVIESAFDRGINYLYWGTVRQPGFAEAMRNLEKQHRDDLVLTIQSYSTNPASITAEVEQATKEAGVANFDFLLLGNRESDPGPAYEEVFEGLKDRGLVKYLSISSHNRPFLPELLDAYANGESPYEILMFRYNAVHRGAEKDIFPYVEPGRRPTTLTYTATRWGHLLDPSKMPAGEAPISACDCYRYSLSHQAVDMVLCGPADAHQMDEAIAALAKGPLDADERARIERIGAFLYGQYAPAYPDKGDEEDVRNGTAAA